MKWLLTILTILVFLTVAQTQENNGGRNSLAVIAYYSGNATDMYKYQTGKLTHIIYSFVVLKGNKLHISPQAGLILKNLVGLKKNNPALKVSVAFGGWGGCKTCSELFAEPANRAAFARSVKDALQQHQLDGIDLDWEYPSIQGPVGHPFSPRDKQTFTELVKALRTAIGETKEISVAAGGFTEFLQQSIDWKQLSPLINRFHLMSYDLVNRYSIVSGHHTPLYSTSKQIESADNAIRFLDSLNIPRSKIVIGAAFYSRLYEQVDSVNNGLYQSCKFKGFVTYKNYARTFSKANGYNWYWDDEAKAPWSYNRQRKLFATFDDRRSVKLKTQYAIDQQLQGIMFWELRQDIPRGGLLDAIFDVKMQNSN